MQVNASGFFWVTQGFQLTEKNFQSYYYRTSAEKEIDLIIECSKGILPIEIKFTQKDKSAGLTIPQGFHI